MVRVGQALERRKPIPFVGFERILEYAQPSFVKGAQLKLSI